MDPTKSRTELVQLLRTRSFRIGKFTLSSGRSSTYYVDARPTTMSARGLELVGQLGLAEIRRAGWSAELVGGMTLGADPIAYAIALASLRSGAPIDAFTVRKEPKGHGGGRQIEGCFVPDARAVVVEDVITSGGSALAAIRAIEAAGGVVVGVLAVVDRLEGGREAIQEAGYEVRSLVTVEDLAPRAGAPP